MGRKLNLLPPPIFQKTLSLGSESGFQKGGNYITSVKPLFDVSYLTYRVDRAFAQRYCCRHCILDATIFRIYSLGSRTLPFFTFLLQTVPTSGEIERDGWMGESGRGSGYENAESNWDPGEEIEAPAGTNEELSYGAE